jgi:hypothetical protein
MKMVVAVSVVITVFAAVLVMNLRGNEVRAPEVARTATTSEGESVQPSPVAAPSSQSPSPEVPNHSSAAMTSAAEVPFDFPDSVHEFCARAESEACRQVEAFVDEMAMEPRAGEWAADMESRIRSTIDTELQGHAQIRALQCRRSRCAVVYAMPEAVGSRELAGDLTFGGALVQNAGVSVSEANSTGDVVSVLTWRCQGGSTCPPL